MTKKINPGQRFTQKLDVLYTVDENFKKDVLALRPLTREGYFDDPYAEEWMIAESIANPEEEYTSKTDPIVLEGFVAEEDYDAYIDGMSEMHEEEEKVFKKEEKIYLKAVSKLRIKYGLSMNYQPYLIDLIEGRDFDECIYPDDLLPPHLKPLEINNPNNLKEIMTVLPITPETSLDEIQRYWQKIKSYHESTNKKSKIYSYTKLRRDLEIFKLHNEGNTAKQIQEIIRPKYNEVLSTEEINIIILKIKKRAIINKK